MSQQVHAANRSLGPKLHRAGQKPCVRFGRLPRPAALAGQDDGSSELTATQGAQQRQQREPGGRRFWGLPSFQLNPKLSPKTLLLSTGSTFLASSIMGEPSRAQAPCSRCWAAGWRKAFGRGSP
jgi:hypothetical protein